MGVLLCSDTASFKLGFVLFYGGCHVFLQRWRHVKQGSQRQRWRRRNTHFELAQFLLGYLELVQLSPRKQLVVVGYLSGFILRAAGTHVSPEYSVHVDDPHASCGRTSAFFSFSTSASRTP